MNHSHTPFRLTLITPYHTLAVLDEVYQQQPLIKASFSLLLNSLREST